MPVNGLKAQVRVKIVVLRAGSLRLAQCSRLACRAVRRLEGA